MKLPGSEAPPSHPSRPEQLTMKNEICIENKGQRWKQSGTRRKKRSSQVTSHAATARTRYARMSSRSSLARADHSNDASPLRDTDHGFLVAHVAHRAAGIVVRLGTTAARSRSHRGDREWCGRTTGQLAHVAWWAVGGGGHLMWTGARSTVHERGAGQGSNFVARTLGVGR